MVPARIGGRHGQEVPEGGNSCRRGAGPRVLRSAFHAEAREADHRQAFAAGGGTVPEGAEHAVGHHADAGLVEAARRHALVPRIDQHGDALGLSTVSIMCATRAVSFSWTCRRLA